MLLRDCKNKKKRFTGVVKVHSNHIILFCIFAALKNVKITYEGQRFRTSGSP